MHTTDRDAAAAPAPIHQRARAPHAAELADIPWLAALDREERSAAVADLKVARVAAGELLCRVGRPVTYWFGVIDGLLKMSNDSDTGHARGADAQSMPITFTGMPPGGWFGEGTVIKREVYRYNIQALRSSVVAGLSVGTFHWLLERSIPFNHFMLSHLNERLGQFIAMVKYDRVLEPTARVARGISSLFHPVLYPNTDSTLQINQEEIGWLVGVSRQRVNTALNELEAAGFIQRGYGFIVVIDRQALSRYP